LPQNQAGPDACWLTSVDDAALTCVVGNGTRLVYPRAAVRDVWVIEPTHGWDARTWIKAGFGLAGIGLGVACIVANPMCAVPFGAVALWWLERSTFPGPVGPPRPQRMRRRLVYRSSTP